MGLSKGDLIPFLELKNQNGEVFNLKSLLGKGAFVVYFYPKNFTAGCTKEACQFRDIYSDFKDAGAEVVAISSDTVDSHQKFKTKYKLPFLLLSDANKKARKAFEVENSLLGLIPGRETFVFDSEGKLLMRYNSINANLHSVKALEIIRKFKNE